MMTFDSATFYFFKYMQQILHFSNTQIPTKCLLAVDTPKNLFSQPKVSIHELAYKGRHAYNAS